MNLDILRRQLELHEGLRLSPYVDTVGKVTIGIGHNLTDVGIRPQDVDALFAWDVARAAAALTQHLPFWTSLDDTRQRVLLDLCFNMGIGGLLSFKNMLKFVQAADWPAAAGCLKASRWYGQVGQRGPRLVAMLETGQDPAELAHRL